jgi:hypothetical protein
MTPFGGADLTLAHWLERGLVGEQLTQLMLIMKPTLEG